MKPIKLTNGQIEEICKLAQDQRRILGFMNEAPIANDLFTILENLNIHILQYPISSVSDRPAFSAVLLYLCEEGKELVFVGVNTADYFDKQIFAMAHELYHYFTKTGTHLSRLDMEDDEYNLIESKANRFAAEFLLPESQLREIIQAEFRDASLKLISIKTIQRFIARLQCTWWLPYRSLVRRLHEIEAITEAQYYELYELRERDLQSEYGKIGLAINAEIFRKLNSRTQEVGTSPQGIEYIIRNFEDHLISEDSFAETLQLFNRTPSDFGYEIIVEDEDLDDPMYSPRQEDVDEG